jgi:hypothetical protein
MATPTSLTDYRGQESEEPRVVIRVKENPLSPIPSSGHVIDAVRNQYARGTRHDQTVRVTGARMAVVVTFDSNSSALFDMAGVRPRPCLFWLEVAV